MTNNIWTDYVIQDPASISHCELETFLNRFLQLSLKINEFDRILKTIDYDNSGVVDKLKMAKFILNMSGNSLLSDNEIQIKTALKLSSK